jgi:hypothetical protein
MGEYYPTVNVIGIGFAKNDVGLKPIKISSKIESVTPNIGSQTGN